MVTSPTPSLVACDLDGTIVRNDGTISARTVAAFERIDRAGARFVLVTGRPPRLMGAVAKAFRHRGTAICANGALIYDLYREKVIDKHLIPPARLAEAARLLRSTVGGIGLAVEYADALAGDARYEPGSWDAGVTLQRLSDAELFGRPAPKLLGRHPVLSADELLRLTAPVLAGIVTVYHSNGLRLVEATAAGVSKASAVADLAARYDVDPAEAVAFGDMPNDLSMLAWAGTSYGVANAHPDVLATVDWVIGANDDDGVAEVLEQLFPVPS
ncbi:HAD family hydrolase [Dactylosporangium sucinum]|uniref:Haloacid dehalogenase n=1 Tax=Dactylosporangium sucinum TaxID=1424081 RepID=A0A917X5P0_9ACTN|nr:HAD family hydrolase [Dactylosporangium sucinum]GGM71433.1 haloacid dehalogenase [Dactylosporangium sucinum]